MGWWIIFPIIFMTFMMFRMIGRGGPMGMMGGMGGGQRHGADDHDRRSHGAQGDRVDSLESPREIAQRRYASGELSREQFIEIIADLDAAAGGPRDEDSDT